MTAPDPRLDEIQARLARRDAMIDDGSYKISQTRCNDPERHGFHTSHPENVRVETSHHQSYISHLEALAEAVPYLLAELRKAREALAVVDGWIGKFENTQSSDAAKRENAQFDLGHSSGRRAAGSILRAAVAAAKGDER